MAFHLVHDIETLNLDRGDPNVVAVGAVLVCEYTGLLHEPFYAALDYAHWDFSNVDPSTLHWWFQQSDAARRMTFNYEEATSLDNFELQVCGYYNRVAKENEIVGIWGNGSDFDNVMIKKFFGIRWSYKLDRCLRTLRALTPHIAKLPFDGIEHYALDDARNEAIDLYNRLGAIHNGH